MKNKLVVKKAVALVRNDWKIFVVGGTEIRQPLGSLKFNYEFVTRITASKTTHTRKEN
jgi:hypothetical protein